MRVNLTELAAKLAKMDNPIRRNVDVIDAGIVLAALGHHLSSLPERERGEVVREILDRAGDRASGVFFN